MNYEDQVLALFGEANPVSDLDTLEDLLSPRLEVIEQRTGDMTDTKVTEIDPQKPIFQKDRRRGWVYGLAAAVVALIFVGVAWAVVANDSEPEPEPDVAPPTPTIVDTTPSTIPDSAPPEFELPAGVGASVVGAASVGTQPMDITLDDDGYPWVAMLDEGMIAQLDPLSGEALASYRVSEVPTGLVYLDGSLWVAHFGRTACPRTGPCPWMVSSPVTSSEFASTLDRIEPATGALIAQVSFQGLPTDIEVTDGSIWVSTDGGGGTVLRIDPATDEIVAEIDTGATTVSALAATPGTVWVASETFSVIGIDTATNQVSTTIGLTASPSWLVASNDYLWVSTFSGKVLRIDLATNEVDGIIELSDRPRYLSAAFGYVWASGEVDGLLTRIDPTTSEAIDIQTAPGIFATKGVGDRLWVLNMSGSEIYFVEPALVE